ncbi:hypothetical protein FSARC_431 [Fusarium sarcochroum]|uniref:Uncharacterized protein n=1 Tax=Fusarium sarcochroum TaxID=1208366 RepID=A0A8H4UBI5_9HYPO|nr:hypothetical protein FSARC_431 [Fusarium sarcochroum]
MSVTLSTRDVLLDIQQTIRDGIHYINVFHPIESFVLASQHTTPGLAASIVRLHPAEPSTLFKTLAYQADMQEAFQSDTAPEGA